MENKFALGVLVANRPGVLTRVTSLFSRRGFNIDSLTVGETENHAFSRITVAATGDNSVKEQLVKQLSKLIDVKNVAVMEDKTTIYRELLLVKVYSEAGKRSEIIEAATIYRGSVVDLAASTLTIELTGESSKIDAFIDYLRPFGIREMCRTGISAVARGSNVLSAEINEINI